MKRLKFLKILSLFVSIIIISVSLFVVPASALYTYNFVCSRPQINNNSCYFEVVTDGAEPYVFFVSVSINAFGVSPEMSYDRFSVNFETKLINGNLWVYPSDILSLEDGLDVAIEGYDIYSCVIRRDGSIWSGSVVNDSSISFDGPAAGLSIGENYNCLRAYNANCTISRGSDMIFSYANEININNKLDGIISGIQGGNQQIMDNANQNADKVTANQDKNAEKVTNGWSDSTSIDNSVNESYYAADEELSNKTAEARSSSINFLNNFGSLLNDTSISKGLLSVSKIMTQFFNIGWFSGIVNFSLSVGAFAFILGSVIMVVGRVSNGNRNKNKGGK